jgi:hypothetical protein
MPNDSPSSPSCHTRRPRPASQWRRLQPWAAPPSRNLALARLQAAYRPFSSARLFALSMPIAHGAHHVLHRAIALSGAGLIASLPSAVSVVARLRRRLDAPYPYVRMQIPRHPSCCRTRRLPHVRLVRRRARQACQACQARRPQVPSLARRRLWATPARPVRRLRRLRLPGSHSGGVLRIAALGSCPFLTQIFAPNRRSGCPCPHSRRRALQLELDTLTALAFAPFAPTPSTPAPKARVCLDGRSARARPAASMDA